MKRLIICFAAVLTLPSSVAKAEGHRLWKPDWPIHPQYQEYYKCAFKARDYRKLDDERKETFFNIYQRDSRIEELLDATGGILGEAPPFAEAKKTFPDHYPHFGRMEKVRGRLEWERNERGKALALAFTTDSQRYYIQEYHLLHRLDRLGFNHRSAAQEAIMENVCWMMYQTSGINMVYVQGIELH